MSVLVEASHPSIPGANVREGLLLRGALIERERIVALLEAEVWDSPELAVPYVRHIVALIRGEQS